MMHVTTALKQRAAIESGFSFHTVHPEVRAAPVVTVLRMFATQVQPGDISPAASDGRHLRLFG